MEGFEPIDSGDVESLLADPMGAPESCAPLPRVNIPTCLPPGKDLLASYTALAHSFGLLSAEDEMALALAWRDHQSQQAADALVCSHLRLVVAHAHRHAGQVDAMDLIQEGTIGLLKALRGFDPARGIRFSSYAKWWIHESIMRHLLSNVRLVDLGSTRAGRTLFYQLARIREELTDEGLKPTADRIAERLQVPASEVVAVAARMDARATSLTAPVGDEGRAVRDVLADDGATPSVTVECERAVAAVAQDLAHFATTVVGHIERHVWALRLCSAAPLTIADLAERLRVSVSEVQASEDDLRGRLLVWVTG